MKSSRSQFYTWIELGITEIWMFSMFERGYYITWNYFKMHLSCVGFGAGFFVNEWYLFPSSTAHYLICRILAVCDTCCVILGLFNNRSTYEKARGRNIEKAQIWMRFILVIKWCPLMYWTKNCWVSCILHVLVENWLFYYPVGWSFIPPQLPLVIFRLVNYLKITNMCLGYYIAG